MSKVREQVIAHLAEFAREAIRAGGDGYTAIKYRYPDTPDTVAWEAVLAADAAETEEWWRSIERTIEGEVIENSLKPAKRQGRGRLRLVGGAA